jgi:N6-adenosine-specific RNA methylase IME4
MSLEKPKLQNLIRKYHSISDLIQHIELPISIGVLSVLMGKSEEEIFEKFNSQSWKQMGGLTWLVAIQPVACVQEFIPGQLWIPNEPLQPSTITIRDDILSIHRCASSTGPPASTFPGTCEHITLETCGDSECIKRHFVKDLRKTTNEKFGLCSYLDLCRKIDCKYLHFQSGSAATANSLELAIDDEQSQTINIDIRKLDFKIFESLVSAIVVDPPWDIHMELSYGTMTDDEMRGLRIGDVSTTSGCLIYLWCTVRTLEVARECLSIWGFQYITDIVWIKTNTVGGTVRSGRTGHWLNHNKEHCLVGMKGDDISWATFGPYMKDCDVIVAPVRENSRKPDELYNIVERMVRGSKSSYCLELFGRSHNLRPCWITVGNQLGQTRITDPILSQRLTTPTSLIS